mmetsp:Transcript_40903/g.65756  ORF Transcript_40903/g.65756 Transcript_40903/m.65756 type:complete len:260 (+) Transcript_40903:532-1311(+)|eukprot:jgi/Bigna1/86076/estExt_fgenesh1_pg.C_80026
MGCCTSKRELPETKAGSKKKVLAEKKTPKKGLKKKPTVTVNTTDDLTGPETPLENKWASDTPRTRKKKVMRHIRSPSHTSYTAGLRDFGMKWKIVAKESRGLGIQPTDEFKKSFMGFQLMSIDDPTLDYLVAEFTENDEIKVLKEFDTPSKLDEDVKTYLSELNRAALIFANISIEDETHEVGGFIWVPQGSSEVEIERYSSMILKTYMKLLTSAEPGICKEPSDICIEAAKKRAEEYVAERDKLNEAHGGIYALEEEK